MKNSEHHPMTRDLEEMEYGVPNPNGKLTGEKMPIELKAEVTALKTCDMGKDYVDTIKNELVKDL